jgi:hypothetical protein
MGLLRRIAVRNDGKFYPPTEKSILQALEHFIKKLLSLSGKALLFRRTISTVFNGEAKHPRREFREFTRIFKPFATPRHVSFAGRAVVRVNSWQRLSSS